MKLLITKNYALSYPPQSDPEANPVGLTH